MVTVFKRYISYFKGSKLELLANYRLLLSLQFIIIISYIFLLFLTHTPIKSNNLYGLED